MSFLDITKDKNESYGVFVMKAKNNKAKYIPYTPESPCVHSILSERAYKSIIAETSEHDNRETGGILLGHYHGGVWYIIEAVDPGLKTVNQTSFFEFDDLYVNHVIKKLSRIYRYPLSIIALWHKHPGSFDRFSTTDLDTIESYTSESVNGILSMIVNVDPSLRLTFYYCGKDNTIMPVRYDVGDNYIPKELIEMADGKIIYQNIGKDGSYPGITYDRYLLPEDFPDSIHPELNEAIANEDATEVKGKTVVTKWDWCPWKRKATRKSTMNMEVDLYA